MELRARERDDQRNSRWGALRRTRPRNLEDATEGRSGSTRRDVLRASVGVAMAGVAVAGATETAAAGGTIEWTYEADQRARTAPTVVDGTVYVGMSEQPSHRVHAIDAATGDHREAIFQDRPVNAATVVNDVLFVAQDGGDAAVEAYDAATDDRLYSVDVEYAPSTQPVVFDGMIYLGSDDGVVYALDAWTGEREWLFETDDSVASTPLVADGIVYVGCDDAHLYAIDAETGEAEWAFAADGPIRSSPTIADGTVYVGEVGSRLLAIDAEDGDLSWEYSLQSSEVSASPTVADGAVYVGDWEGYMYAVDAEDGSERWTLDVTDEARATRGDGERVRSSPTVADGLVFVFSDDGYLYAIDTERGDVDWRFDTETPIGLMQHAPSPTVVDGIVYFSNDTTVYAIDAGIAGSGAGSRMQYGTLGHHDTWAETAAAADRPSLEEIHQPRDVGGGSGDDDGSADDPDSTDDGTAGSGSDDSLPGLGVASALASIGGVSYLLARRGTTKSER
ncbi:outer membrane protein assembly factor BamB family protein [Natrialba swarupiae]